MNRRTSAYAAYVQGWTEQHPNVVEPTRFEDFTEIRKVIVDTRSKGRYITTSSKVLGGGELWITPEGRYVELTNGNGTFDRVVVFENSKDYNSYDRPLSMNEYWNC